LPKNHKSALYLVSVMDRLGVCARHLIAEPCSNAGGVSLVDESVPESNVQFVNGEVASVRPSLSFYSGPVRALLSFYSGPSRSLVPDGKIFFTTNPNGGQDRTKQQGFEFSKVEVTVHSARQFPGPFDQRSFGMQVSPTSLGYDDFFVHERLINVIFPESEALLKNALGAAVVLPFDYIVRSIPKQKQRVNMSGYDQGVQGVATTMHGDYTLNGAPRRLDQLGSAPKANDVRVRSLSAEEVARAKNGRYCFVNLWRNIRDEPLEKSPLAVCDASTVVDEDLACLEQRMVDRTGENYWAHHNPQQTFYYYPRLTRDEVLMLKVWDSADLPVANRFTLHGSFRDPSSRADAHERESIEVRCLCIF